MAYAKDHELAHAETLGYVSERTANRGDRFEKGARRIWALKQGWQSADLIGGRYCNHQAFASLTDALERPSGGRFRVQSRTNIWFEQTVEDAVERMHKILGAHIDGVEVVGKEVRDSGKSERHQGHLFCVITDDEASA